MSNLPATFALSDLTPTQRSQLLGGTADSRTGQVISAVGDVNGDGFGDFIIASSRDSQVGYQAGALYLVYGDGAGLPAQVTLSALGPADGVILHGATGSGTGKDLAVGDLNGDGLTDLVVLSAYSNRTTVVFGSAGGFATNLAPANMNGTNGFVFSNGGSSNEYLTVGDFNGDGIDDLAVANDTLGPNQSGAVYVLFGRPDVGPASLGPGQLNGANGYVIQGAPSFSNLSKPQAADINGDGIDDLIIAGGSGSEVDYVVFGHTGPGTNVDLAALNGTNGFRVVGSTEFGRYLTALDINGDGIEDAVLSAYNLNSSAGGAYVVFGHTGPFAATIDVATLDGSNGFLFRGETTATYVGADLANAGDVNNDGIDDLLIGSFDNSVYLLLGRATGFGAVVSTGELDGRSLIRITDVPGSGFGTGVDGVGDVNGDGIDDFVVSTPFSDQTANDAGASYLIYGQQGSITRIGTVAVDTLDGNSEADELYGLGGKDVLNGFAGGDLLDGGADNDVLYGGTGNDQLLGGLGNDILDGGDDNDDLNGGAGSDKLFGGQGADALQGGDGLDRMEGGAGVDTLRGGADNDYLDGGAGADIMIGGTGNDVYIVDDAGDTLTEDSAAGFDIVRTALGWILGSNFEGLELQGFTDVDGTGNAAANNLQGNGGDNTLSGLGGVDTINGGDGDDIIIGGAANDLLRGGTGADVFRVLQESIAATLETDQVYDFSAAEGDTIDLEEIDADSGLAGNQDFTLVGAFSRHAGEMTLTFAGGITTLRLDVNGDGRVDYQMKINGDVTGESGNWIL